jgi:DNA-binding response OmpR family regulator
MTTRVLIVEDEPLVALEMEAVLRRGGFEIAACVGSLKKALDVLNNDCDIGVLDANLRGETVEPVAVALRQCGKPFLFVSGYGRVHLPWKFLDARVIPKPFDPAELIRAVMQICKLEPAHALTGKEVCLTTR